MNTIKPTWVRQLSAQRWKVIRAFLLFVGLGYSALAASEHQGRVVTGSVPVPGAVVTVSQDDRKFTAVTNEDGKYSFPDLADGSWNIQIQMTGFAAENRVTAVRNDAAPAIWDLKIIPLDELKADAVPGFVASAPVLRPLQVTASFDESGLNVRTDGLLINGSINNGASTPFALPRAIGNNRKTARSLYTSTIALNGRNSVFDARAYSLTGQNTPRPPYTRLQGSISFGGPLQIPQVFRNGSFSVSYSRTQNRNATLWTAQMPTAAERTGDFSSRSLPLIDPSTGTEFQGNRIPADRLSPQAIALLAFYPLPNFSGPSRYNYQITTSGATHDDNLQGSFNNVTLNTSNRFTGSGGIQSSRSSSPGLFGFSDTAKHLAVNAAISWTHRFTQRISGTVRYRFDRAATQTLPYFSNRVDVSAIAGINGSDRDPRNWGPPSLNFAGGIARLTDAAFASNRNQSDSIAYSSSWIHGKHSFTYGTDFKRQKFNLLSQQDARGSFAFTGYATGNDFADFLLSLPATSSIAFGNADKYFRQSFYSAFVTDDWRVKSSITLTLGVRWEYESPITEKYGRLVNLNLAPDFSSASTRVAGSSIGSLIHPDKSGIQPRIGWAWRPSSKASTVVRAGYGIYRDVNVYRSIADQMSQQSPLSKSFSLQTTAMHPLSLEQGLLGSPQNSTPTFAVDPLFHAGTAQNWQLSIQQDLPQSMQVTASYLGIKGTHIPRRILPNTYPLGASNPCPGCPVGFVYLTSNGNSSRQSGTVEVRRRQRNGFQASIQYTFAKAIDDAGLGGASIVQNWLDPGAERGPSNFDQRHSVNFQMQYTSGMLTSVGGFWDGWRGWILKQWTLTTNLTAGSGMPLTPILSTPIPGTGFFGSLRPDVTGAAIRIASTGPQLNPLAFTIPLLGQWGNAGRNSITGPAQFALSASLARTFRFSERVSMDFRVDSTNVLNHATFSGWNTNLNSAQFGLPQSANAMRTIVPSMRLRF